MFIFLKFIIFFLSCILISIFTYYVNIWYLVDLYSQWFKDEILQEYEYIIVGAGSAGALLAVKLADYGHRVLLIEAGGTPPLFLDIPLLAPLIQETAYDWQYRTVPQHHACKGLYNNESRWPAGKILGGSSRLNYMAYVRGHHLDYHGWFSDFTDSTNKGDHSMTVNTLKWSTELADATLEGVKEMGHQVGNINENLETGFMRAQLSMENGKRWSTDKLLYKTSLQNLNIVTHARVNKILVQSRKARGIQFTKLQKNIEARAEKGVILSAGAIGSPKLLMLSGIGPKEHLKSLKIEVINDLPVGQHLVDHILTGLDLITINTTLSLGLTNALNPLAAMKYFLHGDGPWTSPGIEALGTFHSESKKNSFSPPDLQLMILPLGISQDGGTVLKSRMGISSKVYEEYFAPLSNMNAVTIAPVLLHPKSSGEVKLRSSDPQDEPLIDPKYLSHEEDVITLVKGILFMKKLIQTKPMKTLGASLYNKKFPGCENCEFDSIEYWKCYVQHLTLTSYHPAGTCRIGDVVDTKFRVYNMTNLYVVDASVLPVLPSGNIQGAIIMLAEKAARLLKNAAKEHLPMSEKFYKTVEHYFGFNLKQNICYL